MSRDYEKEIEKHRKFQAEASIEINKLLAQRDPCYESRYQDKRNLLLVQLQTLDYEVMCLEEKLESKRKEQKSVVDQIKMLDKARKNWEPML